MDSAARLKAAHEGAVEYFVVWLRRKAGGMLSYEERVVEHQKNVWSNIKRFLLILLVVYIIGSIHVVWTARQTQTRIMSRMNYAGTLFPLFNPNTINSPSGLPQTLVKVKDLRDVEPTSPDSCIYCVLWIKNDHLRQQAANQSYQDTFVASGRLSEMKQMGFTRLIYTNGRESWVFQAQ